MKLTTKISIVIVIILAASIVILQSGVFRIAPALAPLEQREDKTSYTPNQKVDIQATTFNGNIEIKPSTGSQIEVIYNIKTPQGQLYDVKTQTNETKSENQTTLITSAKDQGSTSVNHAANLIIKLPNTSQYNLTLLTANGDIIKPQLNDTKITASTSNGNINIEDGSCNSIEAITMNGNVRIGLTKDTLFQVAASVGNGNIAYQGIALNTTEQSATRLKGATSAGEGTLSLTLMTANGKVTIEYLTQ